jgi:hypothetical protein
MKKVTVPVPPYRPYAERDDNVLAVQEFSYLWGSTKRLGLKPP